MTTGCLLHCVQRDVQTIIYKYLHQFNLNACFDAIFKNMCWNDKLFRWICIENETYTLQNDGINAITGLFQHRTSFAPNIQIYKIIIEQHQFIRKSYEVPHVVRHHFQPLFTTL